jgi:hypothetical protein
LTLDDVKEYMREAKLPMMKASSIVNVFQTSILADIARDTVDVKSYVDVPGDMTIRNWLLDLLPNVDGPTLHALSEQFKNDSIVDYGDMIGLITSEVLALNDVKLYTKNAYLTKMKAASIINEFQKIVAHQSLKTDSGVNK